MDIQQVAEGMGFRLSPDGSMKLRLNSHDCYLSGIGDVVLFIVLDSTGHENFSVRLGTGELFTWRFLAVMTHLRFEHSVSTDTLTKAFYHWTSPATVRTVTTNGGPAHVQK